MTLKDNLTEWADWDGAAYQLAICLGLMRDAAALGSSKHVFWSDHPIGNLLASMLDQLVQAGILEKRDEPDTQYRWSPAFRGSWEPES